MLCCIHHGSTSFPQLKRKRTSMEHIHDFIVHRDDFCYQHVAKENVVQLMVIVFANLSVRHAFQLFEWLMVLGDDGFYRCLARKPRPRTKKRVQSEKLRIL